MVADQIRPDTRRVIIDLGFDLHLEMPLKEAREYAEARVRMLEKCVLGSATKTLWLTCGRRCVVLNGKRGQIQWQIEQVGLGSFVSY
jgi:hypothetical protein